MESDGEKRVKDDPQISVVDGQMDVFAFTKYRKNMWWVRRRLHGGETTNIIWGTLSWGPGLEI